MLQWLKANLFNTWYNALLTLLAVVFLYIVFKGILSWAFTEANWNVIPANLQIFLVGAYPREEIWRVWIVIYTLALLLGLSAGILGWLSPPACYRHRKRWGRFGDYPGFFPHRPLE